ncbi:protein canopy 4-like [Diadema setosum]|uniref:protein canopy 4-like n=1 Tax=Diadema setosum TaxID=31175 RepID=UPI003B39FEA0
MAETGRTSDVLHLGYRIDRPKKDIKYKNSELRLVEVMDEVCPRILHYNIHAERESSRRFAKGTSETMSTLHGLVDKGVKVELGIPYEMWDEPSAAVTKMKQYCDTLIEEHEETIENWFFKTDQSKSLSDYLCRERVLSKKDSECLGEIWTGQEKIDFSKEAEEEREDEKRNEEIKAKKKREKERMKKEKEKKKKEIKKKAMMKGDEDPLEKEEFQRRQKNTEL